MLEPKEFLVSRPDHEYETIDGLLYDYKAHIIKSLISELEVQRNVDKKVIEYLRGKL